MAVLLVTEGHKWYQWKDENKQNKLQLNMNQSAETRLNQNQTKRNTVNFGFCEIWAFFRGPKMPLPNFFLKKKKIVLENISLQLQFGILTFKFYNWE